MIQSTFIIHSQAGKKCKWCEKAVEALDNLGLPYMLRPLALSELKVFADRAGMSTVPIIYHGVKLIGGYKELVAYLDANK